MISENNIEKDIYLYLNLTKGDLVYLKSTDGLKYYAEIIDDKPIINMSYVEIYLRINKQRKVKFFNKPKWLKKVTYIQCCSLSLS